MVYPLHNLLLKMQNIYFIFFTFSDLLEDMHPALDLSVPEVGGGQEEPLSSEATFAWRRLDRHTARGGRRIWPARGKRAAFSINPGHAPCNYTTNWAGIRGKMF